MKNIYNIFNISFLALFGMVVTIQPVQAADATVSGTVTHQIDGTAVEDMLVYAENSATGTNDIAFTDDTGAYSIDIDDTGSGTAGDYLIYSYNSTSAEPNEIFIKAFEEVTLSDGENKTEVNFSLTRRAKFSGTVFQSNGVTPIYYAYVYFTRTTGSTTGYGADYSTSSGFYSVAPATYPNTTLSAVGEYNITVSASGYFGASLSALSSGANETTTTQNYSLTGESTISGTVVDEDGNPIGGADIILDDISSSYSYLATTDSAGQYTIHVYDMYDYGGTAIGNYGLSVSADGYVTKSRLFEITADESSSTGNDFTLKEGGAITGTIFEANGTTGVAAATIAAEDGHGNSYSATTEADGTYSFTSLKAGSDYTLTVSKAGYVDNVVYGIAVVAGETTANQDIQLTTAIIFSGSIVASQDSAAISGATISLYNRNKPRSTTADYTATTQADGAFIINNIEPGHYRVQINQTGYLKLKKKNVGLTSAVTGRTFQLELAAVIYGNITTKANVPIHNAYVTVSAQAANDVGYGTAYTDVNGNYRINNLKAGKYTVKVSTTDYVEKIASIRAHKGQSKELNIKLQSAGSISGQVRDAATGLPLSYYTVRVRHESVTATADSNGYYTLDGLAAGKYTIYVISSAYATGTHSGVRVRANKETDDINFSLKSID